jgi:hypothetical protein
MLLLIREQNLGIKINEYLFVMCIKFKNICCKKCKIFLMYPWLHKLHPRIRQYLKEKLKDYCS